MEVLEVEATLPEVGLPAGVAAELPPATVTTTREDGEVVPCAMRSRRCARRPNQSGQPAGAAGRRASSITPEASASKRREPMRSIAAEMAAITPKRTAEAPVDLSQATQALRPGQKRPAEGGDNLEIIMGVGPIYAKRLREAGITTYRQLAEASYEVLDKVSRGNLERVIKEDWRGQAQRLMNR